MPTLDGKHFNDNGNDESLETDKDRAQVIAAIREGLTQAERGEGISVADFDSAMRAKYKIAPRPTNP